MIRFATQKDYEQIYKLFHLCFSDSIEEIRSFTDYFRKEHGFSIAVCERKGIIVSMTYLIPAVFQKQPAYYLYAVCTHPDYRNLGLSRLLMNHIKNFAAKKGISCLFLVPASLSLVSFYRSQDFLYYAPECPSCADISFPGSDGSLSLNISEETYLDLRTAFAAQESVLSLSLRGNLFALKQRDPSIHLGTITLPYISSPVGFIFQEMKEEIILLEIALPNQSYYDLAFETLSARLSGIFPDKIIRKKYGNPLCIYPVCTPASNISSPYFAFPMDSLL